MNNQREQSWHEDSWDGPDAWGRSDFESTPKDWRPDKRIVLIALAVVMSVIVGISATAMWYLRQVNPSDLPGAVATNFTVNLGDSLISVSEKLEAEGLIVNAGVFRWYVGRKGGIDLQPGYYLLTPRSHFGEIMQRLNTPPSATFTKITFPEGFTVDKIAARIEEKTNRIKARDFVEVANNEEFSSKLGPDDQSQLIGVPFRLEGLLFPDTYQVSGDETAASVVDRMLRLMERVGLQEGIDLAKDKVGLTSYQVLIVASLIEREAKIAEDRGKIARVIYNRLERGMPLQIDASLYYNAPADASFADLKDSDTPYNSYLHTGLPPTPIASPGRAAIKAALNPTPNPPLSDPMCQGIKRTTNCAFLYYVLSDDKGGHRFAATLEGHEENVEQARAGGFLP